MLTIAQIAAIIGLLLAFGVPQPTVDTVSIILNHQATSTMQDNSTASPSEPQPSTTIPSVTAAPSTPPPSPTFIPPTTSTAAVSQARIETVSPINGKGLGRQYKAYDWDALNGANMPDNERPAGFVFADESNYIELGAVLYNDDGGFNQTARMTITATDGEQNQISVGTGNVQWYYVDGQKRQRHYYPYHYEFKTAGKHTITFEANGVTASVELDVK